MHCYVAHGNIFQLIRMKTCIHYCLFNYKADKKADHAVMRYINFCVKVTV